MNPRRIQRLIYLAAASAAIAAAAVVAAGLWFPAGVAVDEALPAAANEATDTVQDESTAPDGSDGAATEAAASLDRLYQLTSLDLRRPLYDPPPSTPVESAAAAAPSHSIQLIGTVIEPPDRSYAILQRADGSIAFVPLGGTIDDVVGPVKVMAVEPRAATIEYRGASHTLILPKEQVLGAVP